MPTKKSVKNNRISSKKISVCTDEYDKTIEFVTEAIEDDGYEFHSESVSAAFVAAETDSSSEDNHVEKTRDSPKHHDLKAIFDIDEVEDPLVGAPFEVRRELDQLALRLQKHPKDQEAFMKIVSYMHKYILGLVFRKYNFVRGHDDKDIYQESLIALFRKAVPSFRKGRGMSFLNFAKMCINRHLITILNASRNRRKDMPLNTSISLDHAPAGMEDEDGSCALSNIIPDKKPGRQPFSEMARSESFERTLSVLTATLSDFEKSALMQYLQDKSYREAAKNLTKIMGRRCNERSVDNALLRIRKKAMSIKDDLGEDSLPLLFGPV